MSGSEDDIFLFSDNMCNSENTTFGFKGPNINKSNMSWKGSEYNPRFQPNFNRSRYVTSARDATLFRRDTSPMSVRSAFAMPNYYLYHQNGQNYPRSMCSDRGGFPVSLRNSVSKSTCNEAAKKVLIAFSEAEIALIYEKVEFHKNDLRLMKRAYRKFMKLRSNFSTYNRQSDREYSSSCPTNDSSCDDSPRVNHRKKNLPRPSKSSNLSSRQITSKSTSNLNSENCNPNTFGNMIQNVALPRDRFKKGYDLPCQRFNQSVVSSVITEDNGNLLHNTQSAPANAHAMNKHCNIDSGTDSDEENNCENKLTDKNKCGVKRTRDEEDVNMPNKKRFKKNGSKDTNEQVNEDDFIFAKPMFPMHKSANRKKREESLISSTLCSPKTLYAGNSSKSDLSKHTNQIKDFHVNEDELNENESEGNRSISNMSQTRSFIKRKLFTQNLELAEKRNISSDNIQSPRIGHSVKQKDKFKPRKLTNTQYCLTRDVNQEDGNLLDLISKIVPAENINKTNLNATANKTSTLGRSKSNLGIKNKKRNSINSCDDWDITSVISTCDLDNASDTYTDEDINYTKNDNAAIDKSKSKQSEKFPPKITTNEEVENMIQKNNITNPTRKNGKKKDALNIYKCFWDSDTETNFESSNTRKSKQSQKLPPKKTTNEEVENMVQKNNITNPSQKNGLKKDDLNIFKSFWDTDPETDFEPSNTPVKKRINSTQRTAVTQKQSVCNQVKNIENVFKVTSNKSNSILNIDTCNFVLRPQRTPKRNNCCEHEAETQILHKKNMSVTPPINENIQKNPKIPAPKINKNEKHQDTNKPIKQKSNSTVEKVNTKNNQKNNIKSMSKNTAANAGTKKTSKAIEEINKPITNKNIESKNIEAKKKTTKDKTVASNTKEAVDITNKSKSKTKDPVLINNAPKECNVIITQFDLTDCEVSRSLRSREILSNSLVCLENNKKINSKSTKSEANKLQKSILSFAIRENNENVKVVNKKQSSKNKTLLNTSVQTRRTAALNKTKNHVK